MGFTGTEGERGGYKVLLLLAYSAPDLRSLCVGKTLCVCISTSALSCWDLRVWSTAAEVCEKKDAEEGAPQWCQWWGTTNLYSEGSKFVLSNWHFLAIKGQYLLKRMQIHQVRNLIKYSKLSFLVTWVKHTTWRGMFKDDRRMLDVNGPLQLSFTLTPGQWPVKRLPSWCCDWFCRFTTVLFTTAVINPFPSSESK